MTKADSSKLSIYCDGGARGNPGPAAIGVVIENEKGEFLDNISGYIGETTNNVAEYSAVIEALQWIKQNRNSGNHLTIRIHVDSNLIASQLNGVFKVKNENLRKLFSQVKRLEDELSLMNIHHSSQSLSLLNNTIVYEYVPREHNSKADALVNKVLESMGYFK